MAGRALYNLPTADADPPVAIRLGSGDRAGIVEAIQLRDTCRGSADRRGSYGGRQTSMVAVGGHRSTSADAVLPVGPSAGKAGNASYRALAGDRCRRCSPRNQRNPVRHARRVRFRRGWSRRRPRTVRSPAPGMTWARRPSMSPSWRSMHALRRRRAKNSVALSGSARTLGVVPDRARRWCGGRARVAMVAAPASSLWAWPQPCWQSPAFALA